MFYGLNGLKLNKALLLITKMHGKNIKDRITLNICIFIFLIFKIKCGTATLKINAVFLGMSLTSCP